MGAPSPVSPLHIGVSEGQKGGIIPFAVFVQKNPKKNFWKILGKMGKLQICKLQTCNLSYTILPLSFGDKKLFWEK